MIKSYGCVVKHANSRQPLVVKFSGKNLKSAVTRQVTQAKQKVGSRHKDFFVCKRRTEKCEKLALTTCYTRRADRKTRQRAHHLLFGAWGRGAGSHYVDDAVAVDVKHQSAVVEPSFFLLRDDL
jgi:hypothetical protein